MTDDIDETLPVVSVFERSPDRGKGLARDMRVRWALEEVGRPYKVRPVSFTGLREPEHRARNPFGQIPTFEDGDLALFESGAIVLHIANNFEGLLPEVEVSRARAVNWIFAAVGTLEPPIVDRETVLFNEHGETWFGRRLSIVEERIRVRLNELSRHLGEKIWLDDEFSAGDLMTVDVLRRLAEAGLLDEFPTLGAYVARAEMRPAFRRAFDAQRDFFLNSPGQ